MLLRATRPGALRSMIRGPSSWRSHFERAEERIGRENGREVALAVRSLLSVRGLGGADGPERRPLPCGPPSGSIPGAGCKAPVRCRSSRTHCPVLPSMCNVLLAISDSSLSSSSTWAGAEEVAADVVPRRRGFFPLARVRLIAFQGEARVLLTQSTKSGRTAWMNLSTSPGVYMSSTCNGVAAM